MNQLKSNPNFKPAMLDRLGLPNSARAPKKTAVTDENSKTIVAPTVVVHGARKVNDAKDHKWGPLGW